MSAVMVAPMDTMVACGAMVADDARAMHGHHPAAASAGDKGGIDGRIAVIIGIVIRIVVVIDATDKSPAEVTPVAESVPGKSMASCNACRSRADRAAANDSTANTTTRAKTAADATATAPTASTATATAMSVDFNRQSVGNRLSGACHSRIDRRQRFGSLAGKGRRHQQCDRCAQRASHEN